MRTYILLLSLLLVTECTVAQVSLPHRALVNKGNIGKNKLIRQADGSLIYFTATGGNFYSGRILPNSEIDDAYNGERTSKKLSHLIHCRTLAATVDKWDRFLIAGSSCLDSTSGRVATMIRLDKNGDADVDFLPGIVQLKVGDSSEFVGVHVEPGERIIAYGVCYKEGRAGFFMTRLMYNGDQDKSFGTDGVITDFSQPNNNIPVTTAMQPDGKLVVASHNNAAGDENYHIAFARYFPNGEKDSTYRFEIAGKEHTVLRVKSILVQTGNRLIVAGESLSTTGGRDIFMYPINENGSCDTSFGGDGSVLIDITNDDRVDDIIALPDGRILLSGAGSVKGERKYSRYILLRFSADGVEEKRYGYGSEGGLGASIVHPGYTALGHKIAVAPIDGKVYRLSELMSDNETETILTVTTFLQDSALGIMDLPIGKLQNFVYSVPVTNKVTFMFDLIEDLEVSVKLLDISGKELATIVNKGQYKEGENSVTVNFPTGSKAGKYLVVLSSTMGYKVTVEVTKI